MTVLQPLAGGRDRKAEANRYELTPRQEGLCPRPPAHRAVVSGLTPVH